MGSSHCQHAFTKVIESEIIPRISFVKSSRLKIVGHFFTFRIQGFTKTALFNFTQKRAVKIVYSGLKRPFHEPLSFVSQVSSEQLTRNLLRLRTAYVRLVGEVTLVTSGYTFLVVTVPECSRNHRKGFGLLYTRWFLLIFSMDTIDIIFIKI